MLYVVNKENIYNDNINNTELRVDNIDNYSTEELIEWVSKYDDCYITDKDTVDYNDSRCLIDTIINSKVVVGYSCTNREVKQKPYLINSVYDEYYFIDSIKIDLVDGTYIVVHYSYDV